MCIQKPLRKKWLRQFMASVLPLALWAGSLDGMYGSLRFATPVSAGALGSSVTGSVYASDSVLTADGLSRAEIVLRFRDQAGNELSPAPGDVAVSTTLGSVSSPVTSAVYGEYRTTLTAPTKAGIAYVRAYVKGAPLPDIARVNFTPGIVSPAHSTISASRTSAPADGHSQTIIQVFLKDQFGNDIASGDHTLQLSTTIGQLSSVTHEVYGQVETKLFSPEYGDLGDITAETGVAAPLVIRFTQGAIPSQASANEPIKASLSAAYKTRGYYQAVLTAPLQAGMAEIRAVLDGVPLSSSAVVAFTEPGTSQSYTSLAFGQPSYTVKQGEQAATVLQATYGSLAPSVVSPYAQYTLTNSSIAAVDGEGRIRGLQAGQTVLSATYGGLKAETAIVVSPVTVPPSREEESSSSGGSSSPAPSDIKLDTVAQDGKTSQKSLTIEDVKKGAPTISLDESGGRVILTAGQLKLIADINKQAVIHFQMNEAEMVLPISELDLQKYSKKFGFSEEKLRLEVIIQPPDAASKQSVAQSVKGLNGKTLTEPVAFEVRLTGENGQSAFISTFDQYVTRTIALGASPVPETATGVWWTPESGRLQFVPTVFYQKNGQWYAEMKRKGASVYTVINRPVAFGDVQGHWSANDVELLASKLIVQGRSGNTFAPDAVLTRAEMAALLVRALGLSEAQGKSPFRDTNGGWYEPAVVAAYQAGLIDGYADGTFRPGQTITREELAGMAVKAMRFAGKSPTAEGAAASTFADEASISPWAREAVRLGSQTGLLQGDDRHAFRPFGSTTRAEAAALLKRMLKRIEFM